MSHPQLDELRLMTPRSRTLWVAQWAGVNRLDWEELLGMGEAAMTKMEEANGGDPAARMERLEAIKQFVVGYAGLALTFGVLDFSSEEHKMWCDRVLDLIRQPLGGGAPSRRTPSDRASRSITPAWWEEIGLQRVGSARW